MGKVELGVRTWAFRGLGVLLFVGAGIACGGSDGNLFGETTSPPPGGTASTPPAPPPSPTPTSTESSATATVGSEGGQVTTTQGTGVEIPAGALPDGVDVSIVEAPAQAPPADVELLATPYVFGPSGLQFATPVTIVLAFDPTKLPAGADASQIVVFTAHDGTTDYEPLPTVVRDATHVAATTTHFSVFVPAVPDEPIASADSGTKEEACAPLLCGYYGPGACGTLANGCGTSMDCGPCLGGGGDAGTGADASVGGDGGSTTDGGSCVALTCGNYGGSACGLYHDGCNGQVLDCKAGCGDAGASDGGSGGGGGSDASVPDGGVSDGGGCVPAKTCDDYAGACGWVYDGCGPMYCDGGCSDGGGGGDAGSGAIDAGGGGGGGGGDAGGGAIDAGAGSDGGSSCVPAKSCADYPSACGPVFDGCTMIDCTGGCAP